MSVIQVHGTSSFSVQREGNRITVKDSAHQGCRCPGDASYEVNVEADRISIRGFTRESGSVDYTLQMWPSGCTVEDARRAGMRGWNEGPAIRAVQSDTPLRPEQYEQFGLAVASSLVGIPLLVPSA